MTSGCADLVAQEGLRRLVPHVLHVNLQREGSFSALMLPDDGTAHAGRVGCQFFFGSLLARWSLGKNRILPSGKFHHTPEKHIAPEDVPER